MDFNSTDTSKTDKQIGGVINLIFITFLISSIAHNFFALYGDKRPYQSSILNPLDEQYQDLELGIEQLNTMFFKLFDNRFKTYSFDEAK